MDPLITRLALRARYPDNGRVDGISAAEDWEAARMEIEQLREVVWTHVGRTMERWSVAKKHESVLERCYPGWEPKP